MLHKGQLKEPCADAREVLEGIALRDTAPPGLIEADMHYLTGQTIDVNSLTWLVGAAGPQSTHLGG
eukprot:scaffold398992_cov29-Prasinocladus_malaysianus.AAC.1